MNYDYIEQLIDRYFSCQTSLQEEQILRSFFNGNDVPGHLMQYVELFQYEDEVKQESLGSDFDERILSIVNEKKNVVMHPNHRFTPFFRAAAIVAIVLTIGSAADKALSDKSSHSVENSIEINPYIRQADIQNTIKIKDVSQAEARPQVDSLIVPPADNNLQ